MLLHPRALVSGLQDSLNKWPVTVLTGARQTGKTTLVRDLLPKPLREGNIYISLDDPDERLRLASDPVRHLDHPDSLVILDEVQKQPLLLDAVKSLADRRGGHRFLLLGSSQILLLKQVRETLAGRASLLELWPLAMVERVSAATVPRSGLDDVWHRGTVTLEFQKSVGAEQAREWREREESHLLFGGYPALESLDGEDRWTWLRNFRRTYLERDLADLGRVADLDLFAQAQNLVAARTGQLLSMSEISRELGVAVNTVKRYLRFLEISYQVHLLRPLTAGVTARLVKSPKVFWTDPGLARLLSERRSLTDGPLYETMIMDEILRWSSWQKTPPAVHFYRTHGGGEVDFIIHSADQLIALEAKASARAYPEDIRSVRDVLHSVKTPGSQPQLRRLGLIVFRGRDIEQLDANIWAVPDWRLFGPCH
jgi:predicted AAA+ superfamily ATPase